MAITLSQHIVFELGDGFWIEVLNSRDTSLADGVNVNHTFTLTKPGTMLGYSIGYGSTNSTAGDRQTQVTDGSNSMFTLLPVPNVTVVRIRTRQDSGGPVAHNAVVILLMRRPAR